MSLKKFIYNTFNGSKFDEAKRLMKNGQYEDCIRNIEENRSELAPSFVNVEEKWYVAQCYYKLQKYNESLRAINYIVNYPLDDNEITPFKRQALSLQGEIQKAQSNFSNLEVKYPTNTFREFITSEYQESEIDEISFEGISKSIGNYNVKNSFKLAENSELYTIYLRPISKQFVEIFVYLEYIDILVHMNESDTISYHVIVNKLKKLKELITAGKSGAKIECSVFTTTDYAKSLDRRYCTPVLGLKAWCKDAENCNLADFPNEVEYILKTTDELVKEISDFRFGFSDKSLIAALAFAKGAIGKVMSNEIAKPAWAAFKSIIQKQQ